MTVDVLDRVHEWDWEEPTVADGDGPGDRPLVVAYDIRDILVGIQRGVDAANSALALKADKADLQNATRELHRRVDDTNLRVGAVEVAAARAVGWRSGFLVAAGLAGGLVGGLILNIFKIV